jgi:hypothetical protein
MTAFNVLKQCHWMVGADGHEALGVPPWPPKPISSGVHLVGAKLHWVMEATQKRADTVIAEHDSVMQRATDIGALIVPHLMVLPPLLDILMPLWILTSASKSYFGAGTVLVEKKPVATAVIIKVNLNLNCANTVGIGVVIAPNTVRAGMTLWDILFGLLQMVVEGIANYYLGKLLGNIATKALAAAIRRGLLRALVPALRALTKLLGPTALSKILSNVVSAILGTLLGTPLGYSQSTVPLLSNLWDGMNNGTDALTEYLDKSCPVFL